MDALRTHFRPEFLNRIDEIDRVPPAEPRAHGADHRHPGAPPAEAARGSQDSRRADRPPPAISWCGRLRSGVRRAAAQADDSAARARPAGAARARGRVPRGRPRRRSTPTAARSSSARRPWPRRPDQEPEWPNPPAAASRRPQARRTPAVDPAAAGVLDVVRARPAAAARRRAGLVPRHRRARDPLQRVQVAGAGQPGGRGHRRRPDDRRQAEGAARRWPAAVGPVRHHPHRGSEARRGARGAPGEVHAARSSAAGCRRSSAG